MKLFTGTINGSHYTVVCDSVKTQNGFAHNVQIFRNDIPVSKARVNYWNRTWESFQFQSAIYSAISNWKDSIITDAKDRFKRENNLKRVSENNTKYIAYRDENFGKVLSEIDALKDFARTGKFEN